jgi:hypothetical protein
LLGRNGIFSTTSDIEDDEEIFSGKKTDAAYITFVSENGT